MALDLEVTVSLLHLWLFSLLHLWANFITFVVSGFITYVVENLLHLWSIFITFMVFSTFMGDTAVNPDTPNKATTSGGKHRNYQFGLQVKPV